MEAIKMSTKYCHGILETLNLSLYQSPKPLKKIKKIKFEPILPQPPIALDIERTAAAPPALNFIKSAARPTPGRCHFRPSHFIMAHAITSQLPRRGESKKIKKIPQTNPSCRNRILHLIL